MIFRRLSSCWWDMWVDRFCGGYLIYLSLTYLKILVKSPRFWEKLTPPLIFTAKAGGKEETLSINPSTNSMGPCMEHPRGQLQMDHQYGLGGIFVHILQLYWWVPWEKTHLGVLGKLQWNCQTCWCICMFSMSSNVAKDDNPGSPPVPRSPWIPDASGELLGIIGGSWWTSDQVASWLARNPKLH